MTDFFWGPSIDGSHKAREINEATFQFPAPTKIERVEKNQPGIMASQTFIHLIINDPLNLVPLSWYLLKTESEDTSDNTR